MWILPLYLHVNQKSDYDDDDQSFLSEKLQFLEVKFSIYLNTCVFVMLYHICKTEIFCQKGLSKHCRPRSNCSCR